MLKGRHIAQQRKGGGAVATIESAKLHLLRANDRGSIVETESAVEA